VRYGGAVTDHNDWRVTVSLADPEHLTRARQAFAGRQVAEDVHARLGRMIAVGGGGSQIFLYAATEIAAREAERVAREELAALGIRAEFAVHRWHPVAEEWEDPAAAMPQTGAEREAEHQQLLAAETAESVATGTAQWEARVELPSHHDAIALAERLRGEGRAVVRRWNVVVAGAMNEDEARALADQLRQEAPAGATVQAMHSGVSLPFIPF
jgi:hypothetical protein